MKLRLLAVAALVACSLQARADTVALWDFNASTTKHTQSANGASLTLLGGVTFAFNAGVTGQALNTTTYAAQGAEDLVRGVQFMVNTMGYTDITFSFAQRNSGTASAWTALQYTLDDGDTWTTATTFQRVGTSFTSGLGYSFAGISGASNNELFGIRLLSTFAPGTQAYAGTTTPGDYRTNGTIRYDNVLFSGTAIPDPLPVPEPESYVLMLAGLAAVSLLARRRQIR